VHVQSSPVTRLSLPTGWNRTGANLYTNTNGTATFIFSSLFFFWNKKNSK
jgi:hypothetical protein